jgi:hypothetical protein
MGIAEEIALFEERLNELIRRYEQYFSGLEKREPLTLLEEVERTARRYAGTPITNTMVKFKYNSLVARLNSYKQHWNRILRQIEEGKHPRDRFRMKLHEQEGGSVRSHGQQAPQGGEPDDVYRQYIEARKACNLASDSLTPEMLRATLEKQRAALQQKYNCDQIEFRVTIEDGKPKIKARPKK